MTQTVQPPTAPPAAEPEPRPTRRLESARRSPLVWPFLALALLLLVNVIATPTFFSVRMQDGHLFGSVIDIARNSGPVMLVALGMTLVIATRGIDLSVGAIAAIAGAVACVYIVGSGDPAGAGTAITAMALALATCVVLGLWNGFLVSVLGIQPIIATLVLMTAGRGLAMLVTDGQITTVNNDTFSGLAVGFVATLPIAFVLAAAVFALTAFVVRRTALGMLIEAVGINPEASRLAGVRSRTIIWTVYVFTGLCAGLAGLLIAGNTSAADANNAGLWIELDAILAVVIGGTSLAGGRFSLAGTFIGALFITTLAATIPNVGLPSETNYVFKAVAVILVCLIQSPRVRQSLRMRRRAPIAPTTSADTKGASA